MLMDLLEPFRFAFASLRAHKLRSALTTLGVVIGVSAIITVVSFVQGFKGTVKSITERTGSNSLTVRPATPMDMPYEEYQKIKNRDMTMNDMRALAEALPQAIINIAPFMQTSGATNYNGRVANNTIVMTDETWLGNMGFDIAMGRSFVPADMRLNSKVAIIGWEIIERLGINGNPVGQFILAQGMSLEIVGVFEEVGTATFFSPDKVIVIPITTGMAALSDNQRRQLSFQARYDPKLSPDDAEDMVREALRRICGVKSNEIEGFMVFTMKQEVARLNAITAAVTGIAGAMFSIALLVGGIGVMNIMLVSVTERTREIGIRRAVGATRRHIVLQFLIEATLLCLFGGALGILLGFFVGAGLSKLAFDQSHGIPVWAVIAGFGIPAAIGIIFGYYPATKASKLDPVESMRYE